MLARIFTEPEIEPVLRRYDPQRKWQLDTERSYMDTAIFCEPGADLEKERYLKMRYVKPDYLFVERWDGLYYHAIDALYKKAAKGYQRLMRKRCRKRPLYAGRLFPDSTSSLSVGSCRNGEGSAGTTDLPQP